MHGKETRQQAILELVSRRTVATQAQLQGLLRRQGHAVDQATLSRDVRELGLVKTSDGAGRPRYATVEAVAPPRHPRPESLVARLVRQVEPSGNLVVVKTAAGEANPVALALDRLDWPEVAGTVAGDDTLILVVRGKARAAKVAHRILDLKKGGRESA